MESIKIESDWKRFLLEVVIRIELDSRTEISAIELLCKIKLILVSSLFKYWT